MAGSVNKVIIMGNLGKDPEVRNFPNGGKICNFSVATSETWRDRNSGDKQERTQWHNISILSEPLVNIAERFLKKGSKVYLEGQLETRKWQDNSGADRYSTEIVLSGDFSRGRDTVSDVDRPLIAPRCTRPKLRTNARFDSTPHSPPAQPKPAISSA